MSEQNERKPQETRPAAQRPTRPAGTATRQPSSGNNAARPTAARRPSPVYSATNPAGNLPRQKTSSAQNGQKKAASPAVQKKKRSGQGLSPTSLLCIVLAIVAVLVGMTFLVIYLTGFRSVSYRFLDQTTGEEYTVTYRGKLDKLGEPSVGSIHYKDGTKAKIEPLEGGKGSKITYQNGDVYEGPVFKLQRHGQGAIKLANGDYYVGGFAYDKMDGLGTYQFATGDVYYGSFSAGKKSGDGRYTWSDGSSYVGSFKNDLREGEGKYIYADGSVYEGGFIADKKEDSSAKMTIVCEDGQVDTYVGAYKSDARQGHGVYTWASGEVYEGEFSQNLIDGEGTYTWTDGRTYTGHFTAGGIDASKPGQWTGGNGGTPAETQD